VLDIGRRIERTKDVALLLDSILTSEPTGRATLKMLLEVIDCRMTYRSRYLEKVRAANVFDLLLTDETCPRSVASQLIALADHVDGLPHDGADPLRTEEKRLVMSVIHTVRMLTPEALGDKTQAPVLELARLLDRGMKALSEQITRKYLLHSGTPRQITSDAEIPG
jgi:uncharacterized alpha-E superfamily protein